MIVDERTYTARHGQMPAYLDALRDLALPAMKRLGHDCGGVFTTESGMLNQVVHYWRWPDAGRRQEGFRALGADREFGEYRKAAAGLLLRQESRIVDAVAELGTPFARDGGAGDLAVVDARTYTLAIGSVPAYVRIFRTFGLPIMQARGWPLLAYCASTNGTLHQIVHLWYWPSHAARERIVAETLADPEFRAYQALNTGRMIAQENRFLVPTPFSPFR
ncbi:MAG: NIPSNAP family protein [Alphaproteobacteria bacterium]